MATTQPGYARSVPIQRHKFHALTALFFFGFLTVLMVNSLISLIPAESRTVFNYFGEVFVIVSLPLAIAGYFRASAQGRTIILLLGAFAICEILSTIVYPLPNFPQKEAAALGLFLEAKLFVIMLAVTFVASINAKSLHSWLSIMLYLLIFLAWLNLPFVLRDIADGNVNIYGVGLYKRSGFPIPTGLYGHKAISAQMAMIALCAALTLRTRLVSDSRRRFLLATLVISVLQIALSLSVKELMATVLIAVLHQSYSGRGLRGSNLVAIALIATSVTTVVLATPNPMSTAVLERLSRYTGEEADTRIRNKLVSASIDIAATNFPLGTGPGTFASEPSRSLGYSPVYVKYKFYRFVGGRADGEFQFLLDGFWPKILGEGGLAGFAFYLAAIVMLMVQIFKRRSQFPSARIFVFIQYLWVGVLPISLASGILTTERFVLLLGLSGFALVATARDHKDQRRRRAVA